MSNTISKPKTPRQAANKSKRNAAPKAAHRAAVEAVPLVAPEAPKAAPLESARIQRRVDSISQRINEVARDVENAKTKLSTAQTQMKSGKGNVGQLVEDLALAQARETALARVLASLKGDLEKATAEKAEAEEKEFRAPIIAKCAEIANEADGTAKAVYETHAAALATIRQAAEAYHTAAKAHEEKRREFITVAQTIAPRVDWMPPQQGAAEEKFFEDMDGCDLSAIKTTSHFKVGFPPEQRPALQGSIFVFGILDAEERSLSEALSIAVAMVERIERNSFELPPLHEPAVKAPRKTEPPRIVKIKEIDNSIREVGAGAGEGTEHVHTFAGSE